MTLITFRRLEIRLGISGLGLFLGLKQLLDLQWLEFKNTIFPFHFEVGSLTLQLPQPAQGFGVELISPLFLGAQQLPAFREKCLKDLFTHYFFLTFIVWRCETFLLYLNAYDVTT